MASVLLIQLPIPQLNFGRRTGNIPLAAACLQQAVADLPAVEVSILPESIVSYLSDAALIRMIAAYRPEVIGFTVYSWNIRRSLYLAETIKSIYPPRIVFGGPESTPDNDLIDSPCVDTYVCGEGEAMFRRLLQQPDSWERHPAAVDATRDFVSRPSPYPCGMLEPWVEDLMLLESQRGCPHRCAFCYYNKSRRHISVKAESLVLQAADWACQNGIGELYLLDPSVNSRPGLKKMLKKIAAVNADRTTALMSEIRAESLDEELADLFAEAGFTWFEIGLQSTNPAALRIMKRQTDLKRFRDGARLLQKRGITPSIDLIAGLPGDDLNGFKRSVDYIVENGLDDDVQVFPLAVLPGTEFRANRLSLGLQYEPEPPYPVIATPSFTQQDLLMAFDYAESRLDTCLYPLPDLNAAWRSGKRTPLSQSPDVTVRLGKERYVCKLVVAERRTIAELNQIARRLTHPYQVIIGPRVDDQQYICRMLKILTAANPFTALELVFLEPACLPVANRLLDAVELRRPQFLDHEQRYQFPAPGNRSVLFTIISRDASIRFQADMQRQVYWWQHDHLPTLRDIESLAALDGLLVDPPLPDRLITAWQHRFVQYADKYLHIGFADLNQQKRWLQLTADEDTYFGALSYGTGK